MNKLLGVVKFAFFSVGSYGDFLGVLFSYLRHHELAKKLRERISAIATLRKAKALHSEMTESDSVDKVKCDVFAPW